MAKHVHNVSTGKIERRELTPLEILARKPNIAITSINKNTLVANMVDSATLSLQLYTPAQELLTMAYTLHGYINDNPFKITTDNKGQFVVNIIAAYAGDYVIKLENVEAESVSILATAPAQALDDLDENESNKTFKLGFDIAIRAQRQARFDIRTLSRGQFANVELNKLPSILRSLLDEIRELQHRIEALEQGRQL